MHTRARTALWIAAALVAGCADGGSAPSGGTEPTVGVSIAALNLQGVGDVVWDLEVDNGAATPEVVWQRRISSSQYGDGAGSASFVGPCDADPTGTVSENTVKVWVVGVFADPVTTVGSFASGGAGGVVGTAVDFENPTVAAPLSQTVTCRENADATVRFDVSLMRPAQQGFFDIAVSFNDLFCSAKFDCCDDTDGTAGCATDGSEDLALLFAPDGSRAATMVLGFACTAGVDADLTTALYLNPLELDCTGPTDFETGFAADITIDPSGALGNQCEAGAVGAGQCAAVDGATADTYLYQVGVYRGAEQLTSGGTNANKVYWNIALGVKRPNITSCWLRTRGTADDVAGTPAVDGGAITAGTVYPYVQWQVDLATCTEEQLSFGDLTAMVRPAYTATSDASDLTFTFSAAPGAPPAADTPPAVTASAILWLDADELAGTTDGAPVASWPDKSAGGWDASQATASLQPLFVANAFNGHPALSFDGADDYLAMTGSGATLTAISAFAVYRIRAGATANAYYPWGVGGDANPTTGGAYLGFETLNGAGGSSPDILDVFAGYGNDARATFAGISAYDVLHVISSVTQTTSHQTNVYVEGVPATMTGTGNAAALSVPFSSPTGASFAGVGGIPYGPSLFRGDIAELILFDSALSAADRQAIEAYLMAKYGL